VKLLIIPVSEFRFMFSYNNFTKYTNVRDFFGNKCTLNFSNTSRTFKHVKNNRSTLFLHAEEVRPGQFWNIRKLSEKQLLSLQKTNPEYFI